MRWFASLFALMVLVSCESDAPVSERLVSGEVYFSQGSGQELILISRGFGGEGLGAHRLTYELAPDNKLKVSYSLASVEQPIAEEAFELSSELAHQIRREVWRLRPEKFSADLLNDWPTLPLGCERRGLHDYPEIWVIFLPDESKPEGRTFDLPRTESCSSSAAEQSRLLIEGAVASFPNSMIANEFNKAMSAYDPYNYSQDSQAIQSLAN
ncbi:MAG: hypothetical protein ABJP48_02465 [Erythrobacter sp.]